MSKGNGAIVDQRIDHRLEEVAHDMGQTVGRVSSDIIDEGSKYLKTTQKYVKENPVKGLFMAVAAGCVIGGAAVLLARGQKQMSKT
jgi:ElaB/YqjD/DUF883 family membrane-anchored ribosome-binding protein